MPGFLDWVVSLFDTTNQVRAATAGIQGATTTAELEKVWASIPAPIQAKSDVASWYNNKKAYLSGEIPKQSDPLTRFVEGALTSWLDTIKKYESTDPEKAKANLALLTADIMKVAGTTAMIDIGLGMLPNGAGHASSMNTKQLLSWLGFGAVLAAVAHDPVKIGMLRPYQDSLEQTFRNRRPDDNALFQAYRTRELAPEKVEDLSKLDDVVMNRIEADNDKIYDQEISRWGYSPAFALALSRSATRTLSFADLRALANVGYFDRGLSIYSLWGYGLDRVTMKPALDGLQVMRDRQMYSGFRSLIEPSYVDGFLSESDLVAYWTKSGIPDDVQMWILPRMRARREAATLKAAGTTAQKERDLTVSQIQQAYQNLLMDRARAQNMILALGYSLDEAKILLDLAELRRKLPAAQTLKRLTLTDYEKAYKNGLITREDVLARMKGEYAPGDIELERKLLEIGKA